MNTSLWLRVLIVGLPAVVGLSVQAGTGATKPNKPPALEQSGTLTPFDAPGAATVVSANCGFLCGTLAYAINDEGTVVGSYTDEYVVPHGFLRTRDGHVSSFDAPGAGLGHDLDQGTVAYSINDFDVIAGQYQDANNRFHGFIRYPDGSFERIDVPGAGKIPYTGTVVYDINIEGATAGIYIDRKGRQHGFVSNGAQVASIDPLGAVATMVCEETCLSPWGDVAGFFLDANDTFHGFVRLADGTLSVFDAPNAGTGNFAGTYAASITPAGEIAGYTLDDNFVAYGFVRHRDGTFGSVAVPAAYTGPGGGTAVYSIDLWGLTTGSYSDKNLVNHGFERTPSGKVATFRAPCPGCGPYQGTRPSTNNLWGEVAGWYTDASGLNHGFVWTPAEP